MQPPRFLFPVLALVACSFSEPAPSQIASVEGLRSSQNATEQMPSPQVPAAVSHAAVILPEGTSLRLRLLHPLNSKTVVADDPLNFALAEDVSINGTTLAKAGSFAIGRVRQATSARTFGRAAQLVMEMQYLKVGTVRVPLRGSQRRTGQGKQAETVALVAFFGLSGLVKHGSEIEVKEGSIFTAYVDQDTALPPPDDIPSEPK